MLIKAMAQAISAYTMNAFKLDILCDEITSMIRAFWWGQSNGKNKMAWLSWDKVCNPKEMGGLGFRNLKSFNLALLAKQRWQLQTNTQSLVSHVIKARYFPHTDFLQAELGPKPSFAWQSLIAAQCVVREGCRWQIGNGDSARIWHDRWLLRPSSFPHNTTKYLAWRCTGKFTVG